MAVTYQVHEWMNSQRTVNSPPEALEERTPYDVFTGTVGNSISNSNLVRSNEFIVLDSLSATPFRGGATQLRINTTLYFINPANTVFRGIPGLSSPYPCGAASGNPSTLTDSVIPCYNMEELPIYILPGQAWTVEFTTTGGITAGHESGSSVGCAITYILYDGSDAMVAMKLLELGFAVNEENVTQYKMNLLIQQEYLPQKSGEGQ